jgi:hypothetical protein
MDVLNGSRRRGVKPAARFHAMVERVLIFTLL